MPVGAILLVLAAALLHAGWNRLLHGDNDRTATLVIANVAGGFALAPFVITQPPRGVAFLVVGSIAAQTAYASALASAYASGSLAVTYPIARGTAPVLVTVGAWALLDERPNVAALLSAGAVCGGLVLIASAGHHLDEMRAVRLALLTGVCIAGYSTIDAAAVHRVRPLGYLAVVLWGTAASLAAIHRPSLRRLRASLKPGAAVGMGSAGAYLLVLIAFRMAHAANVATLRETSVLLAALFAGLAARRRVVFGAALIVLGAVLAAFG